MLGTGNPLTNGSLARLGNAAVALNLLGGRPRIVWLVPEPGSPSAGQGGGQAGGSGGLLGLIPVPAYLVALQLAVAVLLAALWRARRFGPLIPEPLPTVVRASETVEGHARLYRSRRARGRAAAALREATLARTRPALGLAPDAAPGQVAAAFSARSGSGQARIEAMLFGPAPADDAALVALADDLDALEREVRRQGTPNIRPRPASSARPTRPARKTRPARNTRPARKTRPARPARETWPARKPRLAVKTRLAR